MNFYLGPFLRSCDPAHVGSPLVQARESQEVRSVEKVGKVGPWREALRGCFHRAGLMSVGLQKQTERGAGDA
ncbi:hypothetical protein MHYP_G00165610 [Metynnis hypsauchen]